MSVTRVAVLASSAVLVTATTLVAASPASANLTTRCTGEAGEVTVPGDLVVPAGKSCTLEGTTVNGSVRVAAGADLVMDGVTVAGDVTANADAFVDAIETTIGGRVLGRDQFALYVLDSQVTGPVLQRSPSGGAEIPFLYVFGSTTADVDSRAGETLVESSRIGSLTAINGELVDVIDTVVDGSMTVRRNVLGSVVCDSEVYGDADFRANQSLLQVGGDTVYGSCTGSSYWGGDVSFVNNTATDGFGISDNIVAGDLTGGGNDPLPVASGNRVRGEISLEVASGTSVAGADTARSLATKEKAQEVQLERGEAAKQRVEERRAAAKKEAASTPDSLALTPGS